MEERYFKLFIIVSYNWVSLENEVDTFKSNSQLIYWNHKINNYTIIKRR